MRRLLPLLLALSSACGPRINDVTTTPDDAPRFRRRPEPGYPPGNAAAQREAYPDLAPIARPEPPAAAFAAAAAAARRMPRWEIVLEDPDARVLEAVATTRLLRFKDDIVLEVRPAPAGSELHLRSRSRLGKADFGANAARIRAFAAELAR